MRTSMRQTTSTTSAMTWTTTRATCTSPEHERKRAPCHTLWCHLTCTWWLKSESHHLSSMFMCVSPWVHLSLLVLRSVLHRPRFFFPVLHFELHTELDNLIAMQNLRTSANKGSDDAYDVHTSLTGYEPNYMAFSELNDSSGSFSYITPSSDQDMNDVTLGKLLTEAHRGTPRTSRLLRSRRRVSQSVIVVCRVR